VAAAVTTLRILADDRQPGAPAVPFEQLRAELRLQFVNAGRDRRLRQMLVARRCLKAAQTGGPIERFDLL
jgi:hypothetical protein